MSLMDESMTAVTQQVSNNDFNLEKSSRSAFCMAKIIIIGTKLPRWRARNALEQDE